MYFVVGLLHDDVVQSTTARGHINYCNDGIGNIHQLWNIYFPSKLKFVTIIYFYKG